MTELTIDFKIVALILSSNLEEDWFELIMNKWESYAKIEDISAEDKETLKDLYALYNFTSKFPELTQTVYDYTIFSKDNQYIADKFKDLGEEVLEEIILKFPEEAGANIVSVLKDKTKDVEEPKDLDSLMPFFKVAVFSLACLKHSFIAESFNEELIINRALKTIFSLIEQGLLEKKVII